jgi:ATP-binding cassette subfamily C protein LapB
MGQLVAAVMIGSRAMMVDHVSNVVSRISRMKDAVGNLSVFMNLPREYDGSKTYVMKSDLSGAINIKDVSFQYEGAKFPAIDHLNISIAPNEHLALVGQVGSGKSTLVKCIINLFEPSRGQIQLDGIDNTEIDPVLLRRQVHYMSSENYIFKGSVIENVRIADPSASMEKVVRVMDEVGIMRFVKDHPKGVDMPILDGGLNLSTGQRQSIAIARAMLSPAKVLLLDEPTSFCDLEMSAVFMQRLVAACQDKTIIFITHRLSLCQFMHRVVEMKQGKIIKDGAPKEIIPLLVEEAKVLNSNVGKSNE